MSVPRIDRESVSGVARGTDRMLCVKEVGDRLQCGYRRACEAVNPEIGLVSDAGQRIVCRSIKVGRRARMVPESWLEQFLVDLTTGSMDPEFAARAESIGLP